MDSKTIVILGAGIGGIVAARRSSKEGGVWGRDPSQVPMQTCGCLSCTWCRW
jgi:flavin-dependent dehydrogenase